MTEKRMKAAAGQAVSYRNYRRARDRALTKLSQLYPNTYKELLEREKAYDEAQGRKWIDINGTTNGMDIRPITAVNAQTSTGNHSKNQGYDGGEA